MNDVFVEGGALHDSEVDEQSYVLIVCDAAELTVYNYLFEITVLHIGLMDTFAYHYTQEEFSAGFTKT
eukprot:4843343-Heterocapsa_arctica.AAC.1